MVEKQPVAKLEWSEQRDLDSERWDIDAPYPLGSAQIEFYRKNGFIKLKQVFSAEVLALYGQEFTKQVIALNTQHLPLEQRSTYQKAFLQVMNLWRHSPLIQKFVLGKRLGQIATKLMGVEGVRLYHDQALYKEGHGGITPWHADQYYWPVSNSNTCTAWIPLQATPFEMGPLAFARQSQSFELGRELPISDASEAFLQQALAEADLTEFQEPFELGEISFHSGWTFHRAGANTTGQCREVMTIIYMDKNMRLTAPTNKFQQADWDEWCPGAIVGEIIDSPLNPVIYSI